MACHRAYQRLLSFNNTTVYGANLSKSLAREGNGRMRAVNNMLIKSTQEIFICLVEHINETNLDETHFDSCNVETLLQNQTKVSSWKYFAN